MPAPVGSNLAFACTGNYVVCPHLCVSQNSCGDESPWGPKQDTTSKMWSKRKAWHSSPRLAKNLHASLDECNKVAGNDEPMPMQHRGKEYTEHLVYILMCVSNCQKMRTHVRNFWRDTSVAKYWPTKEFFACDVVLSDWITRCSGGSMCFSLQICMTH